MHSSSGCAVTIKTLSFGLNGDARGLLSCFSKYQKGLSASKNFDIPRIRSTVSSNFLKYILSYKNCNKKSIINQLIDHRSGIHGPKLAGSGTKK